MRQRIATPRSAGLGWPKGDAAAARNGAGSSRIESMLKSLADLLRTQEAELDSLRRDNERFTELRKLFAS